jgi:hypothetical protein
MPFTPLLWKRTLLFLQKLYFLHEKGRRIMILEAFYLRYS